MESPILFLLIPLVIGAVALGVWSGSKPIREMRRDPAWQEQWKLPFRERWRYGKLARSEQPITDPEEARRARNTARLGLRTTKWAFSKRQVGFLVVAIFFSFGARLHEGLDLLELLVGLGLPLLFVVAYLANRRAETQMRRTAELNGWDLES